MWLYDKHVVSYDDSFPSDNKAFDILSPFFISQLNGTFKVCNKKGLQLFSLQTESCGTKCCFWFELFQSPVKLRELWCSQQLNS